MTDTRLAESFLVNDRVDALADGAYRVFVNALVWSTSQGTDGRLPTRALRHLHPDGRRQDLIDELVRSSFWVVREDGFEIRNFLRYQTSAEQVDKARELARLRKQKQREQAHQKEINKLVTRDEPRDSPRDGASDERRGPLGQDSDRTGQEQDRTGAGEGTRLSTSDNGEYRGGTVAWLPRAEASS